MSRSQPTAHAVLRRLDKVYNFESLGNKQDPIDELFFIVLSAQTTDKSYQRVYDRFYSKFHPWQRLLTATEDEIEAVIIDAGLSKQRAAAIKKIAIHLSREFGRVTLAPLKEWDLEKCEQFLTSLPRIGLKTARCILGYSLGHDVMPLDTHCYRILTRLGLLDGPRTSKNIHNLANELFPKTKRLKGHVFLVKHGRAVCHALRPHCSARTLSRLCRYPPGDIK